MEVCLYSLNHGKEHLWLDDDLQKTKTSFLKDKHQLKCIPTEASQDNTQEKMNCCKCKMSFFTDLKI